MRLGGIVPWNALDLTRGFFFGLTILLTYLWTERMTRSRLAAYAGAVFAAFAGGTRWLMLLLPSGWVASLSRDITLLGSAAQSVPDLASGLTLPWAIDGAGPIPFPFAFVNGITPPLILSHGGSGMMVAALSILILLLYRFWCDWRGGVVMVVLLSALANLSEHAYLAAFFGLALALILHMDSLPLVEDSPELPPLDPRGCGLGLVRGFPGRRADRVRARLAWSRGGWFILLRGL